LPNLTLRRFFILKFPSEASHPSVAIRITFLKNTN